MTSTVNSIGSFPASFQGIAVVCGVRRDGVKRRAGDKGSHLTWTGTRAPGTEDARETLVEILITRSIVFSSRITLELKVIRRAAINLVTELGVQKVTRLEVSKRGFNLNNEVVCNACHEN